MNVSLNKLWIAGFFAGAFALVSAAGQGQNAAPPELKRTTIGDVKIYGYRSLQLKPDLSGTTVTGPNTTVELPDENSKSLLVTHADQITVVGANKPGSGHLDMTGSVRYTLTQQTPNGVRILKGTAGHAAFRRETRHLVLSGGVEADLTDPRLNGPGTLHSGSVTVDLSASPYKYILEGGGASDIRFTPKAPKPAKGAPNVPDPESQTGPVHVHKWNTGEFQVGKIARFDGPNTVVNLISQGGKTRGDLEARHIQADFTDAGELGRAEATGTVHYRIEKPTGRKTDAAPGAGRQIVTGACNEATYEPLATRVTLNGDIDADLTDSLTLLEPAKLLASRLVITTGNTLRYDLTGGPNHRRLQFRPRPAPRKADPANGQRPAEAFSLGTVTVTGFQTGILEPGKRVEVTAEGGQNLLVETNDPATLSASRIESGQFQAELEPDGAIKKADTVGPVVFHFQQRTAGPVTAAKTANKPAGSGSGARLLQALDGTAAHAVFLKTAATRTITLGGPFNTKVTDPEHLASPGKATGLKGDMLGLDLVTREFNFESPNETITLEFTPKEMQKQPTAGKPAPPADAPK